MDRAVVEISDTLRHMPRFQFVFPDMRAIRALSNEEYARRSIEVKKTTNIVRELLQKDSGVFADLELTEEQKRMLKERLGL
jgi:hypothetical protein